MGNLVSLAYPNGETVRYYYDANSRLAAVNDRQGTIRYHWDKAGNMQGLTYPNGFTYHLSTEEGKVSFPILYEPAADGQGVTITTPFGVSRLDTQGRLEGRMDSHGVKTFQAYDTDGRLRRVDGPNGTTGMYYDGAGRLSVVVGPWGLKTLYRYNAAGQVEDLLTAFGLTRHSYDRRGRLCRILGPDGAATTLRYDQKGRVASVDSPATGCIRYAYNDRGDVVSIRVADGSEMVFRYGSQDLVEAVTVSGSMSVFRLLNGFLETVILSQNAIGDHSKKEG
jgi:YD repeat-containing protein